MRAVVQRVAKAKVEVSEKVVAEIGPGLAVLLGIASDDTDSDISYMVDKIVHLRIFDDQEGKLNLSLKDVGGRVLLVSQFTLLGDCRKGRRPSYSHAAKAEEAQTLYKCVAEGIKSAGIPVNLGIFQEKMLVEIHNDGPVTVMLDSKKQF